MCRSIITFGILCTVLVAISQEEYYFSAGEGIERGTQNDQELLYKQRPRTLGIFQLEKRLLWSYVRKVNKIIHGLAKVDFSSPVNTGIQKHSMKSVGKRFRIRVTRSGLGNTWVFGEGAWEVEGLWRGGTSVWHATE